MYKTKKRLIYTSKNDYTNANRIYCIHDFDKFLIFKLNRIIIIDFFFEN